jgi:chorismate mutase
MVKAVRGATSVIKNDHKSMEDAVFSLIASISKENSISEDDIISIIFSQTKDLNIANPAAALRVSGQYTGVPLFCTQEPEYEVSIPSIVRVLVTYNCDMINPVQHIYLGKASELRTDLSISEK